MSAECRVRHSRQQRCADRSLPRPADFDLMIVGEATSEMYRLKIHTWYAVE
ncbi:hypothetical protein [Streptomyces sp. NPDC059215]|uniref:hypothetical protein n=1 Tax=Streptomyces sp. NPDC059215 TaxID=3346772 RepID=UPI00367ABB0B